MRSAAWHPYRNAQSPAELLRDSTKTEASKFWIKTSPVPRNEVP